MKQHCSCCRCHWGERKTNRTNATTWKFACYEGDTKTKQNKNKLQGIEQEHQTERKRKEKKNNDINQANHKQNKAKQYSNK